LPLSGRRRFTRAWILALLAAALAAPGSVAAAGPASGPAVAPMAAPTAVKEQPIPAPRQQHPGAISGFRLPFASGVEVTITQGWNTTFSHNGKAAYAYDFGLEEGTPVLAAASGVVSNVHSGEFRCGGAALLNHANLITIDHPDGSATQYAHLSAIDVKIGDIVAQGQVIGRSGKTGFTRCAPHLHFARQAQGGEATQSIPVYFSGSANRVFHAGDTVMATEECAAPDPNKDAAVLIAGTFCGTYYGGLFDGPAYFSRPESGIRIDRTGGGPGGYWLDNAPSGYSARWTGEFTSATWRYTFSVAAIGGVRVTLDGTHIVDAWTDNVEPVRFVVTQNLGAGLHELVVEHYATSGRDLLDLGWVPTFADE
jgi:murein DD-endopeptidase MepM/ murein hydrolase activator NlpD